MALVNPAFETGDVIEVSQTQKIKSKKLKEINNNELIHGINDKPPWYNCAVLGIQHYLIALGGIIAVPLLLAEPLCMADSEVGYVGTAMIISTTFFVSGISTIIQSTIGSRLPIVQGSSFSFVPSTLAILNLPHNECPSPLNTTLENETLLYNDTDGSIISGEEVWQKRMREVQGAIIVASVLEFVLGLSGAIGFIIRFIGPLTITPAVALIGLDLFGTAAYYASGHWGISFMTTSLLVIFSYYLRDVGIPFPTYNRKQNKCGISYKYLFKLFSVLIALIISWLFCVILTETNVFPSDPNQAGYRARTDIRSNVLRNSPWFIWPYPGQWGVPVVTAAGVVGMYAGVLAGMIESIGDYYACARLSGAPPPPKHALNRGIMMEGFCCILGGCIGTGGGTTSYSENIGAIGITRVGSRRVVQIAGVVFIVFGVIGKIGALFATIPDAIVGGMFCVMFGIIAAVGLSNLQYIDLNSSRNLFILGFSLFIGLMVPNWIRANEGAINTGVVELDQIFTVLLSTSMFVGGTLGLFLDNTIPGTDEERGILLWRKAVDDDTPEKSKELLKKSYNLPFPTNFRYAYYIPILPEFLSKDKATNKEQNTRL